MDNGVIESIRVKMRVRIRKGDVEHRTIIR
jgi:hypothetical protein